MTSKITYFISGVLATILIIGAVYFYKSKLPEPKSFNQVSTTTNTVVQKPVEYRNNSYGFKISLPNSWKGYSVISDEWEGNSMQAELRSITGPLIFVRHPDWTEEDPRQDIPVMVFTLDQWKRMQNEEFHIGAAPVDPTELGRNKKYVFALPARYNYSFYEGYEEVDQIIRGDAFKAF